MAARPLLSQQKGVAMTLAISSDSALQSLAAELQEAVELLDRSMVDVVLAAVRVGEVLLAIRVLVPHGEWSAWLEANTNLSIHKAMSCQRLATYKDRVLGKASTLEEARQLVSGLPSLNLGGGRRQYPQWMRDEAQRLRATTDMSIKAIARELGAGPDAVQSWLNPGYHKRKKRDHARKKARAEAALKREERRQAAQKASAALGDTYSHLRLTAEALDIAIADLDDPEIKRRLRAARARLTEAEEHIEGALRLA